MQPTITHVRIGAQLIPIADLVSVMDSGFYPTPDRVVWSDGSESWCKVWSWQTESGPIYSRLGVGAYGQTDYPEIPKRTHKDMESMGYTWNGAAGYYVKPQP